MPGLSTTGCSLPHSLPYIFLQENDAVPFFFKLSAGLFAHLRVHPSVLQSFAPVPIISNVYAHGLTGRCLSMHPSANHADHRF